MELNATTTHAFNQHAIPQVVFLEPSRQPAETIQLACEETLLTDKESLAATDIDWLSELAEVTPAVIDDDWLEEANTLIEVGSMNLKQAMREGRFSEVMAARRTFFEDKLGWARQDHPLHSAYERFRLKYVSLLPLGRIVSPQRLFRDLGINSVQLVDDQPNVLVYTIDYLSPKAALRARGLDLKKVSKGYGAMWGTAMDTIHERIDRLDSLGVDAARAINACPRILSSPRDVIAQRLDTLVDEFGDKAFNIIDAYPSVLANKSETITRRVQTLRRLVNVMKGSNISGLEVSDLIEAQPAFLGVGDAKLFTHARLFAEHGREDMTACQIGNLLIPPLEKHLLAIYHGVNGNYGRTVVQKTAKELGATERKAQVLELLDEPDFVAAVGAKVILDYRRYVAAA